MSQGLSGVGESATQTRGISALEILPKSPEMNPQQRFSPASLSVNLRNVCIVTGFSVMLAPER